MPWRSSCQAAATRRRLVPGDGAAIPDGTIATWFVDDLDEVVGQLAANGVEFLRYDGLVHDAHDITDRAGGGRIAWFQDPDGTTFAIEADLKDAREGI